MQKYETKVVVPKGEADACPLCKSVSVIVRIGDGVKTVTCLEGKCGYIAKYKNGKLF